MRNMDRLKQIILNRYLILTSATSMMYHHVVKTSNSNFVNMKTEQLQNSEIVM